MLETSRYTATVHRKWVRYIPRKGRAQKGYGKGGAGEQSRGCDRRTKEVTKKEKEQSKMRKGVEVGNVGLQSNRRVRVHRSRKGEGIEKQPLEEKRIPQKGKFETRSKRRKDTKSSTHNAKQYKKEKKDQARTRTRPKDRGLKRDAKGRP